MCSVIEMFLPTAIRKMFGNFNKIKSVLGHGRDELLTVHCEELLFANIVLWL